MKVCDFAAASMFRFLIFQDKADELHPGAMPGKVYGPKSEFKSGIIGNYEPVITPKAGPG